MTREKILGEYPTNADGIACAAADGFNNGYAKAVEDCLKGVREYLEPNDPPASDIRWCGQQEGIREALGEIITIKNRMEMSVTRTDPVEKIIEVALNNAGIKHSISSVGLDFYLPDKDIHIECKQFHSDRISEQMSRAPNVIVIQGIRSAQVFSNLINRDS